jgi:hypothetical protein
MRNNSSKIPSQYRIKVKGCLDQKWEDWFEGMAISHEGAYTSFKGEVADQSALHGLLDRIRDLNLKLVYLERLKNNRRI